MASQSAGGSGVWIEEPCPCLSINMEHMRSTALFTALLTSSLAAQQLPPSIVIDRNVRVRMRDGVELAADVYRPDSAGKFPVVLTRTPYGRQQAPEALTFARRGYGSRSHVTVYVVEETKSRCDGEPASP